MHMHFGRRAVEESPCWNGMFAKHSEEAWIAAQTVQDMFLTEELEVDT
jgi:hypothetical protein